jgi:hypothetical protein
MLIDRSKVITTADRRDEALKAAHASIQSWRDAEEAKPITFEHAGRVWDGGLVTRQRLQPVLALESLPDGFFWTDAGNNDVPVTLTELVALNQAHEAALVQEGFRIHAQQRQMKSAIETMTLEQLKAFKPEEWSNPG